MIEIVFIALPILRIYIIISRKTQKVKKKKNKQTHKISALSLGNVSRYKFLTAKYVAPEIDLLEKASAINRSEHFPLRKELKTQTCVAEKQYRKFGSAFESNKLLNMYIAEYDKLKKASQKKIKIQNMPEN